MALSLSVAIEPYCSSPEYISFALGLSINCSAFVHVVVFASSSPIQMEVVTVTQSVACSLLHSIKVSRDGKGEVLQRPSLYLKSSKGQEK